MNYRYILVGLALLLAVGLPLVGASSLPANVYIQTSSGSSVVNIISIPFPAIGASCSANQIKGTCSGTDTISGTFTLANDLYVYGNVVIKSGSTLTSNGFSIFATNSFNSIGATITTGYNTLTPGAGGAYTSVGGAIAGTPGNSIITSYGGNGAGGGGGGDDALGGGNGGNTINLGGGLAGGSQTNGNNGANAAALSITQSNANSICTKPNTQLSGAGGGGGSNGNGANGAAGGNGGSGAYGVCIYATTLNLGTINAYGQSGFAAGAAQGAGSWGGGGGAGGGAGSIFLLGVIQTTGTYNVVGGASGAGTFGVAGSGGNGGIGGSGSVIITSTPNTIFPFELYTLDSTNTYTLNSVIGTTQTVLQGGTNTLGWQTTNDQISAGVYNYSLTEYNGVTSQILAFSLQLSMNDIAAPPTYTGKCAVIIQDFPNCAQAPSFNGGNPTIWSIQSDSPLNAYGSANYVTGANNIDAWSNNNQTLTPNIILTYGQFSPAIVFPVNLVNNPAANNAITQSAMQFIASNSMPAIPYTRKLFNTTTYDQQFLTPLNAVTTTSFNWLFNNYTGSASIKEATNISTTNGLAINTTWMGNSLYANPSITVSNFSTLSSAANHYATINNYFSNAINYNTWPTYPVYLSNNANSSLYTFYIYQCNGYAPTNQYLWAYTGASQSSATAVQQYKISSIPFSLPLQNGQQYAFQFWTAGQALIYTQPLSVNPLTITVYEPCSRYNVTNPSPVINATCTFNAISNGVLCNGIDTQDYVGLWQISITYNPNQFTQTTLFSNTIPGSSFMDWQYTLPNRSTVFYYSINSTLGRSPNSKFGIALDVPLFSIGGGLTPGSAYNVLFGIFLLLVFLGVAYINEVAAIIGFGFILILGSYMGIYMFATQYVFGAFGLLTVVSILLLIFRD